MNWTKADLANYKRRMAAKGEAQADTLCFEIAKTAVKMLKTTDEQKLNKTEAAFLEWLRATFPKRIIHIQSVTLKLGDDCRYTTDFVVIDASGVAAYPIQAFETKGYFRDDAKVKIKVAARLYRWMRFTVVTKNKDGTWQFEDINP